MHGVEEALEDQRLLFFLSQSEEPLEETSVKTSYHSCCSCCYCQRYPKNGEAGWVARLGIKAG